MTVRINKVPKSVLNTTRTTGERQVVLNYLAHFYTGKHYSAKATARAAYNPTSRHYELSSTDPNAVNYALSWINIID